MNLSELKDLLFSFWKNKERDSSVPPHVPPNNTNKKNPRKVAAYLLRRLEREQKHPDVRRLYANARQIESLVDVAISLMFLLPPPASGFTQDWLLDLLRRKTSLMLHRNVFYLYVHKDFPQEVEGEMRTAFYDRLIYLTERVAPLRNLVNERFHFYLAKVGMPTDQADPENPENRTPIVFDPAKPEHRTRLKNDFLPCYFSFCRKEFGPQMRDQAFIVGRRPIHDENEIRNYAFERQRERQHQRQSQQAGADDRSDETAWLVRTVKADWKDKSRRISLNAHRFNRPEHRSPQFESELYIGNWRTEWEFSIGAAEHDEIRCEALNDLSSKTFLNKLMLHDKKGSWTSEFVPPSYGEDHLPVWFRCEETDGIKIEDNQVAVKFLKKGVLGIPLLEKIRSNRFAPDITLKGRVMRYGQGQLSSLRESTDNVLRAEVNTLELSDAIQVTSDFWLVRTQDDRILRLVKRSTGRWEKEQCPEGVKIDADNGFSYMWVNGDNLRLARVRGVLYIYPPDNQGRNYIKLLNVDEEAEAIVLAYGDPFLPQVNQDRILGTSGVVGIRCININKDGKGTYALVPVPNAVNPFFAFQPVSPNDPKWAAYSKAWLTFDRKKNDELSGDMSFDPETGQATFRGAVVEVDNYGYNLICGTSFFQIKVSGTPYVDDGMGTTQHLALTSGSVQTEAAEPEQVIFEPTEANIGMRLLNTQWANHTVMEISRSNVALHCSLKNDDGDRRFIKVYYASSVASARRESKFYEQYQQRAAELFIHPPDEMLRLRDDVPPWALVFPHLVTLEEVFPPGKIPTMAQISAIGLGLASLLHAMAQDRLINFDIDPSTICFNKRGRLTIVDFDNVYPMLSDPSNLVPALKGVYEEGKLPAKNPVSPPEGLQFQETEKDSYARLEALTRLNEHYHTYMLAAVLLEMRRPEERTPNAQGSLSLPAGVFVKRAQEEDVQEETARELEELLSRMLKPQSSERPAPHIVMSRFTALTRKLASHNQRAADEISSLLGQRFQDT